MMNWVDGTRREAMQTWVHDSVFATVFRIGETGREKEGERARERKKEREREIERGEGTHGRRGS